jgi:hypothetical protein
MNDTSPEERQPNGAPCRPPRPSPTSVPGSGVLEYERAPGGWYRYRGGDWQHAPWWERVVDSVFSVIGL